MKQRGKWAQSVRGGTRLASVKEWLEIGSWIVLGLVLTESQSQWRSEQKETRRGRKGEKEKATAVVEGGNISSWVRGGVMGCHRFGSRLDAAGLLCVRHITHLLSTLLLYIYEWDKFNITWSPLAIDIKTSLLYFCFYCIDAISITPLFFPLSISSFPSHCQYYRQAPSSAMRGTEHFRCPGGTTGG